MKVMKQDIDVYKRQIQNNVISNILILANFIQTITITKFVYRLTKSKYGYEVYGDTSAQSI